MRKHKTAIFLISFFILLAAVFMTYFYKVTREQPKPLPVFGNYGHRVGKFAFTNQDGKVITQDDVNGKIRVVEYFFTTCKGICPRMNENIVKVYEAFKGNDDVKILSHTVDPRKDTVQAMKAYSLRFDADAKQWMFLTGSKKELYEMAYHDYLVTAADSSVKEIDAQFIHTDKLVLVDKSGRIRGAYSGTDKGDINQLIGDIKELLQEKE